MMSVDILHCIAVGTYLIRHYMCNRKNLTTMAYQRLGLYNSVNLTGEESDE